MNENEIMMENLDVVEEAIELVPEKPGVRFGKIGFGILVAGAVAALGYKCYKLIKAKKTKGSQEVENLATAEPYDFEDDESAE